MSEKRGQTVSLYLTEDVLGVVRQMGTSGHRGFSSFVQESLRLAAKFTPVTSSPADYLDNVAHVMWPDWNFDEDHPYRFDKWITSGSISRVLLMGTTMAQPLTEYSAIWNAFLHDGGRLFVLLQGELGNEGGKPIYTPVKEDIDSVSERRKATL